IILFHVMYKFLLIYRTFPNSFHKWMLDITVPNRFYHFIQMIRKHDTYLLQYFFKQQKRLQPMWECSLDLYYFKFTIDRTSPRQYYLVRVPRVRTSMSFSAKFIAPLVPCFVIHFSLSSYHTEIFCTAFVQHYLIALKYRSSESSTSFLTSATKSL